MFLQRIASLSALFSGIVLEVAHVPSVANDDADMMGLPNLLRKVADAVSYSPVFRALVVLQDRCQGVAGEQPLALATACILSSASVFLVPLASLRSNACNCFTTNCGHAS